VISKIVTPRVIIILKQVTIILWDDGVDATTEGGGEAFKIICWTCYQLKKLAYSRHSCEKTPSGKVFLLNRAKHFFSWSTGAIMTGCSS